MIDDAQLARERLLFRYNVAMQSGDDATIAEVLHAAEADPILERMVLDWHTEDDEDEDEPRIQWRDTHGRTGTIEELYQAAKDDDEKE